MTTSHASAMLTRYTCLAILVAAMAVVMLARHDPDASAAVAGGFAVFASVFVALSVALYRPLFARGRTGRSGTGADRR